ncbi:hypothetical protein VB618_09275 [Microvirga sp. CF3062]|uniref:hypothetical protein n=1 Tax=Microvirga sp. CF3062 TaxID=3110182 RepID=UPI002E7A6218|nr:hypothetical protein [Microvirga sp. CF3062]MEE1656387.1 hypothetical protein [Microvirga sp. CF3062]
MSNSEIVKWIELWLDSAGERAYQPAFVSALAHNKFEIIHNTSHNSLELGKDIICLSPDKELIAIQLKGNPGSRFTISQWHEIYTQVVQLVTVPISRLLTGRVAAKHTPILVTNGEVEEDVQAAIAQFNAEFLPNYPGAKPLQIWTRGKLIELFSNVAETVWPADLERQVRLLRSVTSDYRQSISLEDIHEVTLGTLGWSDRKPSAPRSLERVSGLATVMAIFVSSYVNAGNLFEVIKAKVIALTIAAGYLEKHGMLQKKQKRLLAVMRKDLFDTVEEFSLGVAAQYSNKPFLNDNIYSEFGVYHPRKMLVTSILAIHSLEHRHGPINDAVKAIVLKDVNYPFLESEALVPAFLAVFWAKDFFSASYRCDVEATITLSTLILAANNGSSISTFYTLEEAVEKRHKEYLGRHWHEIDRDRRLNMSQFVFSLACLLAKRNWKQTVKLIWSNVTRTLRHESHLSEATEFGFFRSRSATDVTSRVEFPQTWDGLINEAKKERNPRAPKILLEDPVLCALMLIFLPFRATEDVVLWLDRQLSRTWY